MRANTPIVRILVVFSVFVTAASTGKCAEPAKPAGPFMQCKTFFQTNVGYDPRLAIATDAVVVHRHGDGLDSMSKAIGSWKEKGFVVGRMFFSDSDANSEYWKGKWDGKPHDDEVERDPKGNVVLCSGFRPYMLPTEGWTRHLEEMTRLSIQAGADAILPEEPLAHSFTGYEGAFKPLFEKRFGIPWQPESASPEAHFLTCQLKTELYLELERRLARVTKAEAERLGKPIDFLLPVHPLYSNLASRLVAPMGSALGMQELDGYVGQVWTGPVNWALANYSSPDKSFFTSAYALYDYFAALTDGTDKKMWMLADPVEDDPNHKWSEFEQWYRHCLAAKLMFPQVENYEVMPWPDRIFLPGGNTGGGTPAPEPYRISLLSAIEVLQEIPGGKGDPVHDRFGHSRHRPVGIAIGDSALWMPTKPPVLEGLYSLMMPLVGTQAVSACVAERWTEPKYLERFTAVVVSYENFVPMQPEQNTALAEWVKRGGALVVLGGSMELKGSAFWWTRLKQPSPLHHLLGLLGMTASGDADQRVGKGWVLRREVSPRQCASTPEQAKAYQMLVGDADLRGMPIATGEVRGLQLDRGPYTIAHAVQEPLAIDGPLVDVLDADLPVLAKATLQPGETGIYRRVADAVKSSNPSVLHCTHRLMEQIHRGNSSRVTLRGPAGTPAVVRLFTAGRQADSLTVKSKSGEVPAKVRVDEPGQTMQIRFENVPEGATVEIAWKKK